MPFGLPDPPPPSTVVQAIDDGAQQGADAAGNLVDTLVGAASDAADEETGEAAKARASKSAQECDRTWALIETIVVLTVEIVVTIVACVATAASGGAAIAAAVAAIALVAPALIVAIVTATLAIIVVGIGLPTTLLTDTAVILRQVGANAAADELDQGSQWWRRQSGMAEFALRLVISILVAIAGLVGVLPAQQRAVAQAALAAARAVVELVLRGIGRVASGEVRTREGIQQILRGVAAALHRMAELVKDQQASPPGATAPSLPPVATVKALDRVTTVLERAIAVARAGRPTPTQRTAVSGLLRMHAAVTAAAADIRRRIVPIASGIGSERRGPMGPIGR